MMSTNPLFNPKLAQVINETNEKIEKKIKKESQLFDHRFHFFEFFSFPLQVKYLSEKVEKIEIQ